MVGTRGAETCERKSELRELSCYNYGKKSIREEAAAVAAQVFVVNK